MPLTPELAKAAHALNEQRFSEAENICRRVLQNDRNSAAAWHLLGLTRRSQNDFGEALACVTRCVELEPRNAEARTNLAQLLKATGQSQDAESQFELALKLAPGFRPAMLGSARLLIELGQPVEAGKRALQLIKSNSRDAEGWSALGSALQAQGQSDDAIAAFREAIALRPAYAAARSNLIATLASDDQPEAALKELRDAHESLPPSLTLLRAEAASLMQLDRFEEAEAVMNGALRLDPSDAATHRLLVQLRYVRGDQDFAAPLRAMVEKLGDSSPLLLDYAEALRRSEQFDAAENQLQRAIQARGPATEILVSLAALLLERNRLPEALRFSEQALLQQPQDPRCIENQVAIKLAMGNGKDVLHLVEAMLARKPNDQRWITYRIDIARQCGEPLATQWSDHNSLVQRYAIEAPDGFPRVDDFLVAARNTLEKRHWAGRAPLDQSLRDGTQTSRGLQHDPDPIVQALLRCFQMPLRRYQEHLRAVGTPPPLLRVANAKALCIAGCWSVRLRRGGAHVNHIHPQGAVSSAFYLTVPDEVQDSRRRSGWIKFGETRWASALLTAQYFVQPKAGELLLFPSYMWHGTNALTDDQPRMTVAFDAVPAR